MPDITGTRPCSTLSRFGWLTVKGSLRMRSTLQVFSTPPSAASIRRPSRLDRLAELLRGLERRLQAPQGLDAPTAVDDHGRRPRQRHQLLGQPKQTLALARQVAALDRVQVTPDAEQPLDVGFGRLLRQVGPAGVDGPVDAGDPVAALDPRGHGLVARQVEAVPVRGRRIGDDRHQQGPRLGAVRPALQERRSRRPHPA